MSSIAIVCYCPRCDYFIKTYVATNAIGTHGCMGCQEGMEVYVAQGRFDFAHKPVDASPDERTNNADR